MYSISSIVAFLFLIINYETIIALCISKDIKWLAKYYFWKSTYLDRIIPTLHKRPTLRKTRISKKISNSSKSVQNNSKMLQIIT